MKASALFPVLFSTAWLLQAQDVLSEYDWAEIASRSPSLSGSVTNIDGRTALRIVNTNDTPLQSQLLKIENPGISGPYYAIEGELCYDTVRGDGYLEMWNTFPAAQPGAPESRYFSRTLAQSGEMGRISGSSDWRRFLLPFNRTGSSVPPVALEMNLVLPGAGTVFLGPIRLVEFSQVPLYTAAAKDAWWSDRTAGWIGAIGGTVIGSLGGLMAWFASRRKARAFVLGMGTLLLSLAVILALGTILALAQNQPYAVWFPLALGALILFVVLPNRLREYRQLYADQEIRRIAAADALSH